MAWSSAAGGLYVFGGHGVDSGGGAGKCKSNQDANLGPGGIALPLILGAEASMDYI